jgi:hypothetical protein
MPSNKPKKKAAGSKGKKYPYPTSNWEEPKNYPTLKNTSMNRWAWEFLRRNPVYQKAWDLRNTKGLSSGKEFGVRFLCDPLNNNPFEPKTGKDPFLEFLMGTANMFLIGATIEKKSPMNPYEVLTAFDVRRPIQPQINLAQKFLRDYQKIKDIKFGSHRKNHFVEYLRILDARAAGIKPKRIKEALFNSKKYSSENFDVESTFKDRNKRALEYRDSLYLSLPLPR